MSDKIIGLDAFAQELHLVVIDIVNNIKERQAAGCTKPEQRSLISAMICKSLLLPANWLVRLDISRQWVAEQVQERLLQYKYSVQPSDLFFRESIDQCFQDGSEETLMQWQQTHKVRPRTPLGDFVVLPPEIRRIIYSKVISNGNMALLRCSQFILREAEVSKILRHSWRE